MGLHRMLRCRRSLRYLSLVAFSAVVYIVVFHINRRSYNHYFHHSPERHPRLPSTLTSSEFFALVDSHSQPIIIIDPVLLLASVDTSKYQHNSNRLITVAVPVHEHTDTNKRRVEGLIGSLQLLGYKVHRLNQPDPLQPQDFFGDQSKIETQYICTRPRKSYESLYEVIQIVLLYERGDAYYWAGGADIANIDDPLLNNISWTFDVPRAFDKFYTTPCSKYKTLLCPADVDLFLWQLPSSRFIECDLQRAAGFHDMFPGNRNEKDPHLRQIIIDMKQIMYRNRAIFWLFSGTLLGWHRQCGSIPYTTDVDTAAWAADYTPKLQQELTQSWPLHLRRRMGFPNDSLEMALHSNNVKVDVFFTYKETDMYWIGGLNVNYTKMRWDYPRYTLCSAEWESIRVNIPCQVTEIIRAEYGRDWFLPRHNWSWHKSPPNVRENGHWPEHLQHLADQHF